MPPPGRFSIDSCQGLAEAGPQDACRDVRDAARGDVHDHPDGLGRPLLRVGRAGERSEGERRDCKFFHRPPPPVETPCEH
jgi:hypothetical protein